MTSAYRPIRYSGNYTPVSTAKVMINGRNLSINDVAAVARYNAPVSIAPEALERMKASREVVVQAAKSGRLLYGITTGIGAFKDKFISSDRIEGYQAKLLLSHAAGTDDWTAAPLPADRTRAMMLLAANKFATGYCGVNPEYAEMLSQMLNKGILPYVPVFGSLGSSGDLIPLAHLGLLMIGHPASQALAEKDGTAKIVPGLEALKKAGIAPVKPWYKDGLSMINSTNYMTALASLGFFDCETLVGSADIIAPMTMEALELNSQHLDPLLFKARNSGDQMRSADNCQRMLEGSGLSRTSDSQDAYSLRLVPSHNGSARGLLESQRYVIESELNACTDNPVIDVEGRDIRLGGNFDGTNLALLSDTLISGVGILAKTSAARINRLMNSALSKGLPPFLVYKDPGENSGLMIFQYSADASLLRIQGLPRASALTVSTSADQEDVISNGANAAVNLADAAHHGLNILGVEAISAAQALQIRNGSNPDTLTSRALATIRKYIPFIEEDTSPAREYMKTALELLRSRELLDQVK